MRLVNYWVEIGLETLKSPKPTKKLKKQTNVHWGLESIETKN